MGHVFDGSAVPDSMVTTSLQPSALEQALKGADVEFSKTRPARLFLEKMGQAPDMVLTPDAVDRFERLFMAINEKLKRHVARDAGAFR